MKTKALYIHMPEHEFVRLKTHVAIHQTKLQHVVRVAIKNYLDENRIKDALQKNKS